MRIVDHGQQAFGKAVLEALIKRGENVVGVYVAPEKEGAKADPLKEAAIAAKLPVFQPSSYKDSKVWDEFKALKPGVFAVVFEKRMGWKFTAEDRRVFHITVSAEGSP